MSIPDHDRELVARRGFAWFVRLAWPYCPPVSRLVWNWHLGEICRHYEAWARAETHGLLCAVPPGHSKSTIVSRMLVPWIWTWMPEYRMIQATYERAKAEEHNGAALAIMQSRWYRERWGDVLGNSSRTGHFSSKAGGYMLATTPFSRGTGYHAHGVNVDDPIKADTARTAGNRRMSALLDRVNGWWDQTMSSRVADPARGLSRSVVMQRLHENDLIGHCLRAGTADWDYLYLPAKFEPVTRCVTRFGGDHRTREGEVLDSNLRSVRYYDQQARAVGGWPSPAAQSQLQQHPSPPGGAIFKAEWFKHFTLESAPAKHAHLILSVDCSFKGGPQSDFVALEVWGAFAGKYCLYDSRLVRAGFTDTVQEIAKVLAEWPQIQEVLIEDAANGPAVIETLRQIMPSLIVVAEPAHGGVAAKAAAAAQYYSRGDVFHAHGATWLERKERQLVQYPSAVNDDDVAAGAQAILFLARTQPTGILEAVESWKEGGWLQSSVSAPKPAAFGFQADPFAGP